MSSFVLDCSVAASWVFDDEIEPRVDDLLDQVKADGAVVPAIWHLELGNVIVLAEKRGRLTSDQVEKAFLFYGNLAIGTDQETTERAFREIARLARAEGLTTYDAAYLELAVRRRLPLATLDKDLIRAAKNTAVDTLPN